MDFINKNKLIQYLSGRLSVKEEEEVEQWIEFSEENRKIIEDIFIASNITDRLLMMKSIDEKESLSKLDNIIIRKQKKRKLRRFLTVLQRTAAILFIPALILAALWYPRQETGGLSYVEIKANRGTTSSFILPDSTKVWLNAGSKIQYPSYFSSNNRTVILEGEALFTVKEDTDKPFIVISDTAYSVEVLGTIFNISAYTEDDHIETTLINGRVKVKYHPAGKKQSDLLLKPNEKAIYSKKDGHMEVKEIDGLSVAGWKYGQLTFNNHPMSHVTKILSRHYGIEFRILDQQVLNSAITGTFKNEQLPQVLKYIELATGIKYRMIEQEKCQSVKSIIELYI